MVINLTPEELAQQCTFEELEQLAALIEEAASIRAMHILKAHIAALVQRSEKRKQRKELRNGNKETKEAEVLFKIESCLDT